MSRSEEDSENESDEFATDYKKFLQYMLYKRMPTKQDVENIHKKLFPDSVTNDVKDTVALCNKKIKDLSLDIQEIRCEVTGTIHYALIPVVNHTFFKYSSAYTVQELEYFRNILNMIVTSHDGYMQSIDLLNSCTNISKFDCQNLIQRFIDDKYLMEKAPGQICLTPLALAEFEPLLKEQFEDQLDACDLCRKICVFGFLCVGCQSKFHNHCKQRWLESRNLCPKCDKKWD